MSQLDHEAKTLGKNLLASYGIDDDLSIKSTAAIEVTVLLTDGRYRWRHIMTPEALFACGDWIDGTEAAFTIDLRK